MNEALPVTDALEIPATDLSYEALRSSGPGGQHVNKSETQVRLRFALDACAVLAPDVKERIRERYPSQVTGEGELLVACDTHRSQHRNLAEARDRLAEMVRACLEPPKPRRPTRPSRACKERRLRAKRQRAELKRTRGKVDER